MTTNSCNFGRLAAGSLAAVAVAVLAAASPAAGTGHPASDPVLSFQPASLPQTADAVDGWYDHGWTRQHIRDTGRGWFIQRKTGERFATGTGRPSPKATETSTADPAANWRRLIVEVP